MARILILTDRPQTDDRIVSRAVELAYRLESREVSVVVTRGEGAFLTAGCLWGNPDGGVLSQDSSVWALSLGCNDVTAAKQFFARCRHDAGFYGLTCETARSDTSLRRTAAMLASVVGLMVVSRETLLDDDGKPVSLRALWSEVKRPWLICPTNAEPWKRIVVATRSDAPRDELIAWGRHWSERFDVPLASIELGSPPPRSVWSAVTRWRPWSSPRQHREAAREAMLACGLGPGDLLLVDREPATWPHLANACQTSLDDLVAAAPCSVGIAPTIAHAATRDLLFPHGRVHADEPILDIVAA